MLEIGCGEAGVLKAFTELGWQAVGVDLAQEKLQLASQLMATEIEQGQLRLINKNIYEESFKKEFAGQFDLIILKDVIEHIPQQSKLLSYLHTFLKQDGVIFLPSLLADALWRPPADVPIVFKKVPYFHLLPRPLYRWVLKLGGEPPSKIEGLLANKRTGITIERFERILKRLVTRFYTAGCISLIRFTVTNSD